MKTNKQLATQFKKHLGISKGKLSKQYSNTRKCQSFYAGDFMSYEDTVSYTDVTGKKKKALVKFNKVKPYVNSVKGFMAQNRRKPKYEARIEQSQVQELFTSYANAISDYLRNNADADQVETQQDGDMLINGYGAVETALSYGEGRASVEEEGEMLMGRLDPLAVGWDPFARATNLTDARWVYYCREYALEDAMRLFDDSEAEDFEETSEGQEGQYEYFPNGGIYDKIAPVEWADKDSRMVKVFFYQWYEVEEFYKVPNPLFAIEDQDTVMFADIFLQTMAERYEDFNPRAEILVCNEEAKNELEDYFGPYMQEAFEYKRKVFYSAVLSGDKVFTKFKSLSQQGFSIQFKTGDFDAANGIWTGMVNSMMEPALYFNKALTELMYTIASNAKGGVMYESDAVEDIAEFEKNYAKTDGNVEVAPGAISGGKIKPKAQAQLPTGLDNIINIADQSMSDVNGFDPTFMGSREFANDTALFQRQRIKQVMSTLACYFDAATLYQKRNARLVLDLMRVFVENNENMTVRVVGEEGRAMFLRLSSKQLSAEYDVTIGEAPLTQQDKAEQATILQAMGDKLLAVGDSTTAKVLFGLSIDLMPLDYGIKERAKEAFEPAQQEVDPAYVKQLEAQVQALQGQMSQAQLQKLVADTARTEADTQEALAKVEKTRADIVKTLEESKQTNAETQQTQLENTLAPQASKITVTI